MSSTPIDVDELKKNLQMKLERLIELQNTTGIYQQLIETNSLILSELLRTKQALRDLLRMEEKSLSGLISIGAGIFTEGIIRVSGKLLVDIGAGIAIPMTVEEAITALEKKERRVREVIEGASKTIAQLQNMMTRLQEEIESLRKQLEKAERIR